MQRTDRTNAGLFNFKAMCHDTQVYICCFEKFSYNTIKKVFISQYFNFPRSTYLCIYKYVCYKCVY